MNPATQPAYADSPLVKRTATFTRYETTTLSLTGANILAALRAADMLPPAQPGDKALVTFAVPGGGDWSSCELDVDPNHPVTVTVTSAPRTSSEEVGL